MSKLIACNSSQLESLKPWLDEWVNRIEQPAYIKDDPVSFMHAFDEESDQILAGFFAALMAWGRRDVVIAKTEDLLARMDHRPTAFIRNFRDDMRPIFDGFKHRTFKPIDIFWLVKGLQKILHQHNSFEAFWENCYRASKLNDRNLLAVFHHAFFELFDDIPRRTRKHISNPEKGSAAKRLWMYLRWVIRRGSPVDPGIMHFMGPSELMIPLDVHSARQARALGLLTRTYNDWKAVQELTKTLRKLDPADPAKYDFALFGIGVRGETIPNEFVVNTNILE